MKLFKFFLVSVCFSFFAQASFAKAERVPQSASCSKQQLVDVTKPAVNDSAFMKIIKSKVSGHGAWHWSFTGSESTDTKNGKTTYYDVSMSSGDYTVTVHVTAKAPCKIVHVWADPESGDDG